MKTRNPETAGSRAGVALGSNLGRRLRHLIEARDRLREWSVPGSAFLQAPVYQTAPVDCPDESPDFFNSVVELDYAGSAEELARRLHELEAAFGRLASTRRNEPRILDLDLLYFGERRIATPELTVPHPRMLQRRFVLQPLAEIRPDLILPGDTASILDHLRHLDSAEPPLSLVQALW